MLVLYPEPNSPRGKGGNRCLRRAYPWHADEGHSSSDHPPRWPIPSWFGPLRPCSFRSVASCLLTYSGGSFVTSFSVYRLFSPLSITHQPAAVQRLEPRRGDLRQRGDAEPGRRCSRGRVRRLRPTLRPGRTIDENSPRLRPGASCVKGGIRKSLSFGRGRPGNRHGGGRPVPPRRGRSAARTSCGRVATHRPSHRPDHDCSDLSPRRGSRACP